MSNAPTAPSLDAETGWKPFNHTAWLERPNYVSGDPDGNRLRIRYYYRESDMALVGKAWFGPGTEGPPGHAHGGSMAALLDEAMGTASWISGHLVLAAKIEVNFRKKLPLGTVVKVEAWLEKVNGRKVFVRGQLIGLDDLIYAESSGLFIKLEPEQFGQLGTWMVRSTKPRE